MQLDKSYEILKKIYDQIEYLKDDNVFSNALLDDFDFDVNDQEAVLKYDEILKMLDSLDDFRNRYKYISKAIEKEGRLVKNETGRYCLDSDCDIYYTSSSLIEFYDEEEEKWVISRVEYSDDYYIVALGKNVCIDNIKVRKR